MLVRAEPGGPRMRRVILSAAGVIVALLLQLTVVNRLPWPGAGTPDLVLLMVVALGLNGRPAAGAVTGFLAGLSLDIAPPASYLTGEYALVFCVVGYGCGLLRGLCGDSVWRSVTAAVAAAAAGEALVSAVGLLVGDPQVSWLAIRHVLPSSVAYDAALSPFVLYLVIRVLAWAGAVGPGNQMAAAQLAQALSPAQARAASAALPHGAGLLGGAGWLAGPKGSRGGSRGGSPVRVPRLREAAARSRDGWIGGRPASWRAAGPRTGTGRPLRLRPGSGQAGSSAAVPLRRELQRRPVNLRLGSRRAGAARSGTGWSGPAVRRQGSSGPGGPSFRGGHGPPGKAFRGGGSGGAALRSRGPGSGSPALRGGPGPRGKAFRGASGASESAFRGSSGPAGSAFRGSPGRAGSVLRGSSGPAGSAFRGSPGRGGSVFRGRPGRAGSAFRGSSGPAGSAFRRRSGRAGPAFRSRGSGPGGPALRGGGHGPPAKAFRRRGRPGPAFRGRRPGPRRSLLAGSGAPARAARFRPDSRLTGGSAFGSPRRVLTARPVTLRLRAPRRRDGVLSSGLALGARRRRGSSARPVRLRLGGSRRGDGMVAGLAPAGRRFTQGSRRAAPRFRARSGSRAALRGRRPVLGSGKQARFRSGRRSLLTGWTRRRLGTRSALWRAGGSRAGSRS